MRTRTRSAVVGVAALLLLAGCSGGDDPGVDAAPGTTAPAATTTVIPANPSAATTTAPPTTVAATATRVSANDATVAELQQAFEAAGISNASKWAREVEEYRPYPDDPSFAKLRQELAKYNPAPAVVEQIVATLALP